MPIISFMKFLLISLLVPFSMAWALPRIDPNKATVCAMTLNSDEERALFEAEVKKHPNDYNPIVELTEYGDSDWFEKACKSGVRCDQLLISGHFTDTFTGTHNGKRRSLALEKMIDKNCSNTCDGILKNPAEIFLMGCNTVATKKEVLRSKDEYRAALKKDGLSEPRIDTILENRYGFMGDDNVTRFQRAFSGSVDGVDAIKKIYGFKDKGPSGRTVDPMLREYFSQKGLYESLQTALTARQSRQLVEFNEELPRALSNTVFGQCDGKGRSPKDRINCNILNGNPSTRLQAMVDAMTQPDWNTYVPTINKLIDEFNSGKLRFNPQEFEDINQITESQSIRNSVLNQFRTHPSPTIRNEWRKFGEFFGFFGDSASARSPARRESRIGKDFLNETPSERPASRRGVDDTFLDGLAPRR